jgi:hypothetical protein
MSQRSTKQSFAAAGGISVVAAVFLLMAGLFQALMGLGAVIGPDYFVLTDQYVFRFNPTTWGWIHLIVGLIAIAVAIGIFTGASWARVAGIVIAALSALSAFTWLPYQPAWSILIIAIDFLVIWALYSYDPDA